MKRRIFVYVNLLIIFLLANCNGKIKKSVTENLIDEVINGIDYEIAESFSNFDLNYETVEINSEEEVISVFADGSEIKIPANTFVTADGKPVTGKVKIKFKSIKTPGEIISSGLHLFYMENDTVQAFTTGGMFEIDAEKDGEKLKIDEGKSLKVNYASIDSANYNLYYYDNFSNNWNYQSEANNFGENFEKEKIENEKKSEKNQPQILKPIQFNEETDFIIMVDLNHKKFNELALYNKVMWKYTGKKSQTEITTLLNQKWLKTNLTKNNSKSNSYFLELISDNQTEKIEITPVFSKAEYNKAMNIYAANTEQKNDDSLVQNQSINYVKREVEVIRLGTYNIDVCALDDAYGVYASFDFSDDVYDDKFTEYKYFVISKNGQMITRYSLKNSNIMAFYENTDNKILSILPDNKVAVISKNDFALMSLTPRSEVTFKMIVIDEVIENEEQLDEIIASN